MRGGGRKTHEKDRAGGAVARKKKAWNGVPIEARETL